MSGLITGVAVGIIMAAVNLVIIAVKERRNKSRTAIELLLKCVLVLLCAMKRSGVVNGDCDDVLDELNEFLIKK